MKGIPFWKIAWVLFLCLGVALYAQYRWNPRRPLPTRTMDEAGISRIRQGGHRVGSSPSEVVFFSRYSCPYCATTWAMVDSMLSEPNPGFSIRVRHLVHPTDSSVFMATLAASCAGNQVKFREFHSEVFESWGPLTREDLLTIATAVNVADSTRFEECLDSEEPKNDILHDLELG